MCPAAETVSDPGLTAGRRPLGPSFVLGLGAKENGWSPIRSR
jgi:hypothetical protein